MVQLNHVTLVGKIEAITVTASKDGSNTHKGLITLVTERVRLDKDYCAYIERTTMEVEAYEGPDVPLNTFQTGRFVCINGRLRNVIQSGLLYIEASKMSLVTEEIDPECDW